jgi:hypothetical protein
MNLLADVVMEDRMRRRTLDAKKLLVFYVAGSRFAPIARLVRQGESVKIEPGAFSGALCLAILLSEGTRIGYVPKTMIAELERHKIVGSFVSHVDTYAVPWKRYEVTVVANETIAGG